MEEKVIRECFVCGEPMHPFIRKVFDGYGLGVVEYDRCVGCGLVVAGTILDMSDNQWSQLNEAVHSEYQGVDESPPDDPRWLFRLGQQSEAMDEAARTGALDPRGLWLDYGCGDGKLADLINSKGYKTQKYDKYMGSQPGYLTDDGLKRRGFSTVINTSMFEHVRDLKPLDEMVSLLKDDGVFAVHTLVREEIPKDPSWFYLLPVHCAMFTNKSVDVLFDRWQFLSSAYHVESRLWLFFKKRVRDLPNLEKLGAIGGWVVRDGFVDYWKQ